MRTSPALRKCCIIVCLLATTGRVTAQASLSLQDLVNAAQTNRPALQEKQAAADRAQAAVTDARHTALPSFKIQDQVSLATANSLPGTYFPTGLVSTSGAIRPDNNYEPASGNTAMLYSEYELANFGLNKARNNDARARVQLAKADLRRQRYLAALQTARTYFRLLKAYQQQTIEQDNVARYDTLFSLVRAQARAGLRAGADTAQTQTELSKARMACNTRAGEIAQLQQDLTYLTGIPRQQLVVDTSLAKYDQRLQSTGKANMLPDTADHPLLDYYARERASWLVNGQLIRRSYLPKLLLVGGLWGRGSSIDSHDQYQSLSSGLAYNRLNYGLGLSLVYNLTDIIHRRDKLSINRQQVQQSDYALQDQQLQLQTARAKAEAAVTVIDRNMLELPVQLESADDLYRQKLAQYRAGVSNLVDLTNAAYLLRQVQTDKIQILTDWFLARLDRAAAAGNLDSFIQSLN
ncbi:TolC family protein [Taibaiella chishuiensis]|uniref:Outer membrane protein TolC n=1 Tax=Taibaiella chishuiensis TaxID=1434707 RepID=A0A2P8D4F1_9BACT|nr:TolC family protein [Taibaiella chishuiensis]PSK92096.1 outer membrane protein TolC [Taibaiella chishuiensis]